MGNAQRLWRQSLSWTIVSLLLAVAFHATRLPAWVLAAFVLLCGWRILVAARASRLPPRLLRLAAVLIVVFAVLATYRTFNGVDAGTALLVLMAALKLLETREPRDHVIILFICYFLLLATFLRDQTLWLIPFHALAIWMITTALLRVTQATESLTPSQCAHLSGRLLAQALPLMVLLFLLFPRISGPFWAVPLSDRARTGLSEELNPGEIAELTLSSDPAFRVRFHGPVPPPAQRYWRGPVLHHFDGNIWRAARTPAVGGDLSFSGSSFEYSLMLEPSGRRWVFALDMAQSWEHRLFRTFDYQLLSPRPLDRPLTIQVTSRTKYAAGPELSRTLRHVDTQLPAERNPRARALAEQLRGSANDEWAYIGSILAMFREQEFVYTLTPPKLDQHSVDDFLFNTRSGFCAHYASAFTMLMRAAGIPARVVTGYQGGEYNRVGEYWIVRQEDAHAWSEVWLPKRGWVRVDPTAAVAPERIERGSLGFSAASAPAAQRLLGEYSWITDIRDGWDALNTVWRERVVDFNSSAQFELLQRLGFRKPDWQALAALLALGLAAFLVLLGLVLARQLRWHNADPTLRAYDRFCRRLRKVGIARNPHEGPLAFARRVTQLRPDLAQQADSITTLYLQLRYSDQAQTSAGAELAGRVKRFKPTASQARRA